MAGVRSIGIVTYTYRHIAMELEDSKYVNHVAAMPKNLTQNTGR